MHQDYVFLLPAPNEIVALPHARYVELVQGRLALPQYAGQQIRLGIVYVRMRNGQPAQAVNTTFSLLDFDATGHARPHPGKFSLEQNHAFYEAVRNSPYEDVDYDPEVQALRRTLRDEFAWTPSDKEQRLMLDHIFASAPPAAQ